LIQTVATPNRADALRVALAYFSFVVIGIAPALLGVATPFIRETFSLSLDAIGGLFITTTIGYFVASFISGRMIARFGAGTLLIFSSLITGVGLLGYGVSPSWLVMVLLGVLVGTGGGFIDTTMNIYFAAHYSPRLMNWLHASYGVGATFGPLLITGILNAGGTWRTAYIASAIFYGVLVMLYVLTRSYWNDSQQVSDDKPAIQTPARATLRLPLVWIGILIFFLYAGIEVTPGQWSFDVFTLTREVAEETAGLWVGLYWGSFTVGRVFFGLIVNWMKTRTLVWICLTGSLIGVLLYAWNPSNTVGFIGLGLIGFSLAPIFPLLMTNTQELLGPVHAPNAIGFEVAAASAGIGLIPGIAGVLAQRFNLTIIPTFLVVVMVVLVALYAISLSPRLAFRRDSAGS
jgi:fucose permease